MTKHDAILELRNLRKTFTARRDGKSYEVKAVNDVSLDVRRGEVLGIVGESGCGKTTIGRTIIRLTTADGGEALLDGADIFTQNRRRMRDLRLKVRMVFQDPYGSFNPRWTVGRLVAEPFHLLEAPPRSAEKAKAVAEALESGGHAVEWSDDAGGYLCNYVFFHSAAGLCRGLAAAISGFVHVGPVELSGGALPEAAPDFRKFAQGAETILRICVSQARGK